MLTTIIHTTNSINPAETTVVVIASHLGLSKIMPIMPNTNDTGAENKMSNPPRTGTGLPQPGLSMHIVRTTAPTIAIKTAESFPKSIFSPIQKDLSEILHLISITFQLVNSHIQTPDITTEITYSMIKLSDRHTETLVQVAR